METMKYTLHPVISYPYKQIDFIWANFIIAGKLWLEPKPITIK